MARKTAGDIFAQVSYNTLQRNEWLAFHNSANIGSVYLHNIHR